MKQRFQLSSAKRLKIEQLEIRQCFDVDGALGGNALDWMDARTGVAHQIYFPDFEVQAGMVPLADVVSDQPLVAFRIKLTDMQGNPISKIHVADEFKLNIYVQDLRELPPDSLHIFSAFTRLLLDHDHFEPIERGILGSDFWGFGLGSERIISPNLEIGGIVTELYPDGSYSGEVPPYPGGLGHLLYSIPIRAIAVGVGKLATIDPKRSDQGAPLDTSVYGRDTALNSQEIYYDSMEVAIHPRISAVPIVEPVHVTIADAGVAPQQVQTLDHSLIPLLPPIQPDVALPTILHPITLQPSGHLPDNAPTIGTVHEVTHQAESVPNSGEHLVSQEVEGQSSHLPASDLHVEDKVPLNQLASQVHYTSYTEAQSRWVENVDDEFGLLGTESSSSYQANLAYVQRIARSLDTLALTDVGFEPLKQTSSEAGVSLFQLTKANLITNSRIDLKANDKSDRNHQIASDFIDRVLLHFGTTSLNARSDSFVWEMNYTRASLLRLPFQSSSYPNEGVLGRDGYSDIAMAILPVAEQEIRGEPLSLVASSNHHNDKVHQESILSYPRASLALLDTGRRAGELSEGGLESSISVAVSQLAAFESIDIHPRAEQELFDSGESSSTQVIAETVWSWKKYLCVGMTSVIVALSRTLPRSKDFEVEMSTPGRAKFKSSSR